MTQNTTVYTTYIVRCVDGSLYTGYTVGEASRRVAVHNAGKGARYTRSRRPVVLVWEIHWPTAHEARSCEALVKQLPKAAKETMVRSYQDGAGHGLPSSVLEKIEKRKSAGPAATSIPPSINKGKEI